MLVRSILLFFMWSLNTLDIHVVDVTRETNRHWSLMGLVTVVVKEIKNSDFYMLVGVVLAPILVTTLVSRQYSMLRVCGTQNTVF